MPPLIREEVVTLLKGDNYIYILKQDNEALVIDPTSYPAVKRVLDEKNLTLHLILNTHHHFDHTGGNRQLKKDYGCRILAGSRRVPEVNDLLEDGATVDFGSLKIKVIRTPGHTLDSLCFFLSGEVPVVFTGDTLFNAGCGRLFEGTPRLMWESLQKLKALPDETQVCPGHDYTAGNLDFARTLFPAGPEISKFKTQYLQFRAKGEIYLKSTIGMEKKINPFLLARDTAEFGEWRRKKDIF